jgi:hypothetical protein
MADIVFTESDEVTIADAAGTNKLTVSAAGAAKVDGSSVTQPVSGTFWQATQPVSVTSLPLPTGAATAANQATEIASLSSIDAGIPAALGQTTMAASMPVTLASNQSALPVTGTFWPTTQPVSGTVTANQGTANTAANGWQVKVTDGTDALLVNADGSLNVVVLGSPATSATVAKTGTLVTTATTADQVLLTYTVTAGKKFYLEYAQVDARITSMPGNANPIWLGTVSLETPSGTKIITVDRFHPPTNSAPFGFSLPIAAGTVVRLVVTPAAATNYTWLGNFGGYEI